MEAELGVLERQLAYTRTGNGGGGGFGGGMVALGMSQQEEADRLRNHRAQLQKLLKDLKAECEAQVKHVEEVKARLLVRA